MDEYKGNVQVYTSSEGHVGTSTNVGSTNEPKPTVTDRVPSSVQDRPEEQRTGFSQFFIRRSEPQASRGCGSCNKKR